MTPVQALDVAEEQARAALDQISRARALLAAQQVKQEREMAEIHQHLATLAGEA